MARSKLHPVLKALQGSLDGVVFKQYGERVVVSRKPDMTNRTLSKKQLAHNERFKKAAAYGRQARDTPELEEIYQQAATGGRSVYHVALRDAMHPPSIDLVQVSSSGSGDGTSVSVVASDDFEVVRVTVERVDGEGEVLSTHEAARIGDTWICDLPALPEATATLRVRALDRPGNAAERSVPEAEG